MRATRAPRRGPSCDLVRRKSMAQPHEVLGVAANADEATINAAFRSAAKRFHPDLNNGDPAGVKRLRRLIAARDFLAKRRWRPANGRAVSYLLPSFRKNRFTKSVALTFALSCAFAFLLLPVLSPEASDNPPPVSIVEKTSPARLASASVDADVPDARLGGDQGHTRSSRSGRLFGCGHGSGRSAVAKRQQAPVQFASGWH